MKSIRIFLALFLSVFFSLSAFADCSAYFGKVYMGNFTGTSTYGPFLVHGALVATFPTKTNKGSLMVKLNGKSYIVPFDPVCNGNIYNNNDASGPQSGNINASMMTMNKDSWIKSQSSTYYDIKLIRNAMMNVY